MLQEVLDYIHNYFIRQPNPGNYTITGGAITPLPTLKDGQRFWIVGSDLNDGVYTWNAGWIGNDDNDAVAGLHDETFAGTICALAVPPAVLALSEEIRKWVDSNAEALSSPLASESFNGYSYTLKGSGGTGNRAGGSGDVTWRDIFGKQLERWRRPYL